MVDVVLVVIVLELVVVLVLVAATVVALRAGLVVELVVVLVLVLERRPHPTSLHVDPVAQAKICTAQAAASLVLDMVWHQAMLLVSCMPSTIPAWQIVCKCSHGTEMMTLEWMHCRTGPGATSAW